MGIHHGDPRNPIVEAKMALDKDAAEYEKAYPGKSAEKEMERKYMMVISAAEKALKVKIDVKDDGTLEPSSEFSRSEKNLKLLAAYNDQMHELYLEYGRIPDKLVTAFGYAE